MSSAYEPLAIRLKRHFHIRDADLELFHSLTHDEEEVSAGTTIVRRGERKRYLMVMVAGWTLRVRYTEDGGRQIVHILLPGDLMTPAVLVTKRADHEIVALTDSVVRFFEPGAMNEMLAKAPTLAAGLWWSTAQEEGMLREQIVRLGRRSARQRIPHLLLELHRRLTLIDRATEDTMVVPLRQTDLADTLGLSPVHVNRTLRQLQRDGLLFYDGLSIQIPDQQALADACDFDTTHLHLDAFIDIDGSG